MGFFPEKNFTVFSPKYAFVKMSPSFSKPPLFRKSRKFQLSLLLGVVFFQKSWVNSNGASCLMRTATKGWVKTKSLNTLDEDGF